MQSKIQNEYFEWMLDLVSGNQKTRYRYLKLLNFLNGYDCDIDNRFELDQNRINDGLYFRYHFGEECGYSYETIDEVFQNIPCSMLEMMVALAVRIEDSIMSDPNYGNRTSVWFWGMMASLGLGSQDNASFDVRTCDTILQNFFNHNYSQNGNGSLFTTERKDIDMRNLEIWQQAAVYLNEL